MGSGTSRGWEKPSCSEADEDWELACWCFGGGGEGEQGGVVVRGWRGSASVARRKEDLFEQRRWLFI